MVWFVEDWLKYSTGEINQLQKEMLDMHDVYNVWLFAHDAYAMRIIE